MLLNVIKFLIVFFGCIIIVALMSLLERKIIGGMQRRKGPNVMGLGGLLQPLADALKLFLKESIVPNLSNRMIFLLSPIILLSLTLVSWSVLPVDVGKVYSDVNSSVLFLLVVSSLSIYGIIMAGWSSNSKYAFLGGLRSAAQMISYEVGIGLYILVCCIVFNSLNLMEVSIYQSWVWLFIPLHMVCVLFFISALAETNRTPFDLPEAEAELVSGYNVEYSSMTFALFFMAEYGTMLVMSVLMSVLYLGSWYLLGYKCIFFYSIKVVGILCLFIIIRGALPRYRYDQLMCLGWKMLLPLALGFIIWVSGIMLILLNYEIF